MTDGRLASRHPQVRCDMIQCEKVSLTPIEPGDSDTLFAWINDADLVRLHGPFRPVSAAMHKEWMAHALADQGKYVMAIRLREGKSLIGLLQLANPHAVHHNIELRIRLGSARDRGRGFGREAVNLACEYAFKDLGMERVFLHVFDDNAPAIAAYEAAGFLIEGLMRRAAFIEGAWKNVVVMGRLKGADPDFTEAGFQKILEQLLDGGYRFARFGEAASDKHVLWRHDVDMSVHRAARLAAIESGVGVRATYFLNPRSSFYSLAEPAVQARVAAIVGGGHGLGLHFDSGETGSNTWTPAEIEGAVAKERHVLETLVGHRVEALSWHNPDMSNVLDHQEDRIAGLPSAYGRIIRTTYEYCSDSNGYWRHRPMPEVIASGARQLHLLTHPEWWTPAPLTAAQRADRALNGRANAVRRDQEALLARGKRSQPDG
jgi:RimJ/RimL family protein N-acetyltransferase